MQSSKPESGTYNKIECHNFPPFSKNRDALGDRLCFIVEPYDNKKLISISILRDDGGFFIKTLNKDGIHIDPREAGPIGDSLITLLNIVLTIKLNMCQFFFAIDKEPILVDVFNGKEFISPGMLRDVFSKRIKTQTIKSIETYDPQKTYNAIIKPAIVCYDEHGPIYVKG